MSSQSRPVPILLVFLALIVVGVLVAVCTARNERRRAAAYLSDVYQLQIGKSKLTDFNRIRTKYDANLFPAPPCGEAECTARFRFENTWLAHLHLARPAYLDSSLTLNGGSIQSIHVGGGCYGSNGGLFVVSVVESAPNPAFTESFRVGGTQGSGKRATIVVRLTPAASIEQRKRAYDFELAFLDRLGACYDADDILPILAVNQ